MTANGGIIGIPWNRNTEFPASSMLLLVVENKNSVSSEALWRKLLADSPERALMRAKRGKPWPAAELYAISFGLNWPQLAWAGLNRPQLALAGVDWGELARAGRLHARKHHRSRQGCLRYMAPRPTVFVWLRLAKKKGLRRLAARSPWVTVDWPGYFATAIFRYNIRGISSLPPTLMV